MARYSLANYILSIKPNDPALSAFGEVTVGGEGNYHDNITISIDATMFSTTGYATGAWVHNKNLSKVGTASVSLSQLSTKLPSLFSLQSCSIRATTTASQSL